LCKHENKSFISGGLVLTIPGKLLCGGIAGAVAQSFSYPLDVTRRRMQLAMMRPETHKFRYAIILLIKIDN
jgi:solute carrier family 25 protein 16